MDVQTNVKTGDVKISAPEVKPPVAEVKPVATPEVQPPKEDLVSRASKVKIDDTPKTEEPIFNVNDIEKISDPQAKELAQKAHKEFERTYQKKFQELAAIRKDYETQLQQSKQWTPERVQSLLSDKEFVNAAQQIIGPQQTDEYSALTDNDKKLLFDAKQEALLARQQNATLLKQQQDEMIKQKYANYAPDYVDLTTKKLLSGEIQATREDLWKVIDYENAVRRAYELGKQDRIVEQKEKIESVSVEGITTTSNQDKPQKEQGESSESFLKRIFLKNLAKTDNIRK